MSDLIPVIAAAALAFSYGYVLAFRHATEMLRGLIAQPKGMREI